MAKKIKDEIDAMQAYEKYISGAYFEKSRAVILKEGKVVFIKEAEDKLSLPNGAVYDNESIEDSAVREAISQTGLKVKPVMPIQKKFYERNVSIGSLEFISKRVAYVYLCEYESEGENPNNVELELVDIDGLKDYEIEDDAINRIKQYLEVSAMAGN